MSVTVTGDGPSIELTGTGSAITITVTTGSSSGGGVTDHGALTGLADDDHTQYAQKANNLSDLTDASAARTNLGLGSAATQASSAFDAAGTAAALVDDLSGVSDQATARTNLGLGSAAVAATGDFATAAQGAKADTAVQPTIVDAKGDLLVATAADTVARLPVGGTNGHVLTVDSAEAAGVKWAAAAGGSSPLLTTLGAQTAVTEAATDWGTAGVNAVLLDSAYSLAAATAGDVIQGVAAVTFTNSSGATRQARPGIRLGSTNCAVGTIVAMGAIGTGVTCSVNIYFAIHVLTTGTQRLVVNVAGDGVNTNGQAANTAATEDFTGALNLQITFGTNNASGTQTATLQSLHITRMSLP